MKKLKPIPKFKTEDAERNFWATHDSTDYFDFRKGQTVVFPNLKRSTKVISLRLPEHLLTDLKQIANKKDVAYQALMKIYLSDRVRQEKKAS